MLLRPHDFLHLSLCKTFWGVWDFVPTDQTFTFIFGSILYCNGNWETQSLVVMMELRTVFSFGLTFHSMQCLNPSNHIIEKRPFQTGVLHQPSLYFLGC